MKRFLDLFLYYLGLYFFAEFIHELIHYLECKGEFVAGLGYIKDEVLVGGLAWCELGYTSGELLPSVIELLIILGGVLLKLRKEVKK